MNPDDSRFLSPPIYPRPVCGATVSATAGTLGNAGAIPRADEVLHYATVHDPVLPPARHRT